MSQLIECRSCFSKYGCDYIEEECGNSHRRLFRLTIPIPILNYTDSKGQNFIFSTKDGFHFSNPKQQYDHRLKGCWCTRLRTKCFIDKECDKHWLELKDNLFPIFVLIELLPKDVRTIIKKEPLDEAELI